MKKLFTFITAIVLSLSMSFAQPISDMGVIPIGVTLNSILRLNIVSGGNIEFVVSTIDQYDLGINSGGTNALYHTNFTVASSTNFDVDLYSENATLIADGGAGTMALDNIGFGIVETGNGADGAAGTGNWEVPGDGTTAGGSVILPLTAAAATIVNGNAAVAAGDPTAAGNATQNAFTICWRLGTHEGTMEARSLLEQGISADRYVTNVILELNAKI